MYVCVFVSSRRRHTRCALVTGVQTCALPIFLDKAPGATALFSVAWIPDPERHAARAPDQRKTWDIGVAVAHEYHLFKRHSQLFALDLAVDRKSTRLNSSH